MQLKQLITVLHLKDSSKVRTVMNDKGEYVSGNPPKPIDRDTIESMTVTARGTKGEMTTVKLDSDLKVISGDLEVFKEAVSGTELDERINEFIASKVSNPWTTAEDPDKSDTEASDAAAPDEKQDAEPENPGEPQEANDEDGDESGEDSEAIDGGGDIADDDDAFFAELDADALGL